MNEIIYKYRGIAERLSSTGRCRLVDVYSEDGESGPIYPWLTKRECQLDAKSQNKKARFTYDKDN